MHRKLLQLHGLRTRRLQTGRRSTKTSETAKVTIIDTDDDAYLYFERSPEADRLYEEGDEVTFTLHLVKDSGYPLDNTVEVEWEFSDIYNSRGRRPAKRGSRLLTIERHSPLRPTATADADDKTQTYSTAAVRTFLIIPGVRNQRVTGYQTHIEPHVRMNYLNYQATVENIPVNANRGDAPVWAHDQRVDEGSTATFELTRHVDFPTDANGESQAFNVIWSTTSVGATALGSTSTTTSSDIDYTSRNGRYQFTPGGADSFTVSIPTRCDGNREHDERFFVTARGATLSGQGWPNNDSTTIPVTIRSRAGRCGGLPLLLSIADSTGAVEGDDMLFTVTLAEAQPRTVTVDYTTVNGSARAGSDYTETQGTLSFAVGETSKTITVPTLMDAVVDDAEMFRVRLSNGTVGIEDGDAVGTITESTAVHAAFRNIPATHDGSSPFNIELHLNKPIVSTEAEVAAAITANDATTTAAERGTSKRIWTITVTPTGDNHIAVGLDHATLGTSAGRPVAPAEPALVWGPTTVSIGDAEAKESDEKMLFTLELSQVARSDVSVAWETVSGTAGDGQDFEGASRRAETLQGQLTTTIQVRIWATPQAEETETFSVQISDPRGPVTIDDDGTGIGTIYDDAARGAFQQPATPRTGDENFTVGLFLRPAVPNVNLADLKDRLHARDATIESVTRKTAGNHREFEVEVDPNGLRHATIALRDREIRIVTTLLTHTTVTLAAGTQITPRSALEEDASHTWWRSILAELLGDTDVTEGETAQVQILRTASTGFDGRAARQARSRSSTRWRRGSKRPDSRDSKGGWPACSSGRASERA